MSQVLAAVSMEAAVQRLLTLGLLKVQYQVVASEQTSTALEAPLSSVTPYSITAFGQAALAEIAHRLNPPAE